MSPILPPILWLGSGLLLMLGELVAPGAFLVWVGLAAFGTGVAALLGLGWYEPQVICFVVLAALAIGAGLRLYRRGAPSEVNSPGSGLVGRTAIVLSRAGAEGRVRVGDSDWPARFVGPVAPEGARLKVRGVEGLTLLVGPAEER